MIMKDGIKHIRELNKCLSEYIRMLEDEIIPQQLRRFERGFRKVSQGLQEYSLPDKLHDELKKDAQVIFDNTLKFTDSLVFDCHHLRAGTGVFDKGLEGYIQDMKDFQAKLLGVIESFERF